ncbi:hypothetical protein [Leptolyngbya sp. PCC 6406]|uniref:hypothetical protein n=1 Tax=Leptolyngbya sp. PCC 6406 TaxID=1173264 RepID=UPI0002AC9384|nr:hypothetical protein [Leptolyngbya sp. PCC 6406]
MKKLAVIGIGISAATVVLYAGMNIYATKTAEARINEFVVEVEDDLIIEYGSVSASPFRSNVTVKNVSIVPINAQQEGVTVDQVVIRKFDHEADFVTALDASMKGIQFIGNPVDDVPILLPSMQQAGYEDPVVFDLDTQFEYKKSSQEATLEKFRIGSDQVGYLEVTLKVSNFDPSVAANPDLTLHAAKIVYQDHSFAENLLASMAAESNQEVGEVKTQLATTLSETAQLFISPDDPASAKVLQETMAFIENPKGFSIVANPSQPLLVSDLAAAGSPQSWITMLNLEIEAH